MRVHRLEVSAFGPFADRQVVDFEALNDAGVFLLTGSTGAGKTSILDAICFGLYGQVPGVRDRAKAYRSDHAPADVPPRVELEVTLQDRRFRLTRQAPWRRPSRRARAGYVEEKARATAEELVEGSWLVRSTRSDEVGHLVSSLLGLTREQFCQVVMLPQGEFQAFLRAGGRERQRILESLFGTQRFQAVERWLVEHRRLHARRCREGEETLCRLVARVQEACPALSSELATALESVPVDWPALLVRVSSEQQVLDAALVTAVERAEVAESTAKTARHAFDEGCDLADRQRRHLDAQRAQATLLATADAMAVRAEQVRRARAAEPLVALVTLVEDTSAARDQAMARVTAATDRCEIDSSRRDAPLEQLAIAVDEALSRALTRATRLQELAGLQASRDALASEIEVESAAQHDLTARLAAIDEQLTTAPDRLAALRAEVTATSATAATATELARAMARADDVLAAAREVERLDAVLAELRMDLLRAREAATAATEAWLDARQRHLAGMAAELAATLVPGEPCPVCGSATHPAPARPSDVHVTGPQESDLLSRSTAASEQVTTLRGRLADAERVRAEALGRSAGQDVATATAAVTDCARLLTAATAAQQVSAVASGRLSDMEAVTAAQRREQAELAAERARLQERVAMRQRELAVLTAALDADVGARPVPDLTQEVTREVAACRELQLAVRHAMEADRSDAAARGRLARALKPTEFATPAAVRAAVLPAVDVASAEALIHAHTAELAAVSRALADPALAAAAVTAPPDLDALEAAADIARAESAQTRLATADVQRSQRRLAELGADLAVGVDQLEPMRAAKDVADTVAGVCTGASADNPTRTALSHYVLTARLRQVVDAANLRLQSIGSGRYQLRHTMAGEAGDRRGGLGLTVADAHTDADRDPATLSGGETFYVSLSLALGLADVVTQEAGGAELATLFVDEGFGSLDDDTRDEVLDELDALRTGGRVVGLVSHLGELRARFPSQLHVVAGVRGSRCALVHG